MAEEILNPLLALIKEQSLIDDLQFEEVVAEHKRAGTPVIQILQDFGIMDLDTILQLEANHLGAQVVSLKDTNLTQELLQTVPANTARMYRCIPVAQFDSTLQVAFEDPLNPARVDELGFIVRKEIQP
ncbi:MAG TPA: pilus assembly protein PilB, partial [Candidatus Polarisedimenticolia bacterium]|nr:pilus assembly protein PilB [Candidatus Polarisedimenticolia bacterium]